MNLLLSHTTRTSRPRLLLPQLRAQAVDVLAFQDALAAAVEAQFDEGVAQLLQRHALALLELLNGSLQEALRRDLRITALTSPCRWG